MLCTKLSRNPKKEAPQLVTYSLRGSQNNKTKQKFPLRQGGYKLSTEEEDIINVLEEDYNNQEIQRKSRLGFN